MQNLAGQTVLITGASRGIGEAAARKFNDLNANVVLLARSKSQITALALELGDNALAIPCDVSRYDDMDQACRKAIKKFGSLDILINNAGVIEPIEHLSTSNPDDWGQVIDINLKGVYNGMRAVLPTMLEAGKGTILTISSGAAHTALEGWSHYCASKAGVAMLTTCAHKEAASKGIRCMGLSPGTVATKMQHEIKASGINEVSQLDWTAHIPPDWPATALVWMCTADADPFLGQEISLRDDGVRRRIGLIK